MPGLTELLLSKGASPERLVEVSGLLQASEAAEGGQPTLTCLTFAAAAAREAGDTGQARRLLDDALRETGDPGTRLRLIAHLRVHGRLADAVELLETILREDPADAPAARQYGATIEHAFTRASDEPPGACPCGSGGSWQDCCGPRERAALDRFRDRSALTALLEALAAYVPGSGSREAIPEFVAEWLSLAEAGEWDPAERAPFTQLAGELSLVMASASADHEAGTGPGDAADDAADDGTNVLTAFAADPSVPRDLAARALTWHEHIHYGLWQIPEPGPGPGQWCTDVVTGATRYVAFPAELVSKFPRWGVLLGGVVPVEGIWRSTGQAVQLSPEEADALAETVADATDVLVRDLAGQPAKRAVRRMRQPVPFGRAKPHGVLAYHAEELPDDALRLVSKVTGSMLLRLAVELHDQRAVPPALSNSDGDPMCMIKARIAVRDPAALAERLADHPDFTRDPDDPARLAWLGRIIPGNQRAAMLAEVRARLEAEDSAKGELLSDDGPQRWIRGQIQVRDGELVADVNSRDRLARLVDLLGELGESPSVTDESRLDPAQHLAWPAGPRVFARGAAPAPEGWEKHWLDEPVPALRGRTPRQAAQSRDWVLLEAMLRQFEYEADVLASDGQAGIDTAWLRQELDMPSDPWE